MLHYSIEFSERHSLYFNVTCTLDDPNPQGQSWSMATWIPGSYLTRDFAQHLIGLSAQDPNGKRVEVKAIDKSTWMCEPVAGPLTLKYQIYAQDASVRGAFIDTHVAYFNPTSVFVYPTDAGEQPIRLDIHVPDEAWSIGTSMPHDKNQGYGSKSYQEFIDHPVVMGRLETFEFEACKVPHRLIVFGEYGPCHLTRLVEDLSVICEHHIAFFGEPVDPSPYTFLLYVTDSGYGGLEHTTSSFNMCSRKDLPLQQMEQPTEEYATLLELLSHEYFHKWNVKRLKPKAFVPYRLTQECYTSDLWVYEGITSYYDGLSLVRSGRISPEQYLDRLSKELTLYTRTQGRYKLTAADSSYLAWVKLYKASPNARNDIVSYYNKGALIAFCLDILLRTLSNDQISLVSLMVAAWQRYHPGQGLEEGALEQLAIELLPQSAEALSGFFELAIRSTADLPLTALLEEVGVATTLRMRLSLADKGGRSTHANGPSYGLSACGFEIGGTETEPQVSIVSEHSPAFKVGLRPLDTLIAINQFRVTKSTIETLLKPYFPGDEIEISFFRDNVLHQVMLKLFEPPKDTVELHFIPEAPKPVLKRRAHWLGQF